MGALPAGWHACMDLTHHQPYYFNTVTQQSQWTFPTAAAAVPFELPTLVKQQAQVMREGMNPRSAVWRSAVRIMRSPRCGLQSASLTGDPMCEQSSPSALRRVGDELGGVNSMAANYGVPKRNHHLWTYDDCIRAPLTYLP